MGIETAIIASALIGTGGSLGSAALASRKSSSTSVPYRTPGQLAVSDQVARLLQQLLDSKGNEQEMRNLGRAEINENYDALIPRLQSSLTARGFGTSGKLGRAIEQTELSRQVDLQKLLAQIRLYSGQRQRDILNQAIAFQNPSGGGTTTTTGPSLWPNAISGIGSDIASMILLSKYFGRAGSQSPVMSPGAGAFTGQSASPSSFWTPSYGSEIHY